jgi:hypothetical protein
VVVVGIKPICAADQSRPRMVNDFAFNALTQAPFFEYKIHDAKSRLINVSFFQANSPASPKTKGHEGMAFVPFRETKTDIQAKLASAKRQFTMLPR